MWDKVKKLRYIKDMWRDIWLYRAGFKRIKPYGSRGRTHAVRIDGHQVKLDAPTAMAVKNKGEVQISARIKRAGSDEWEDLGPLN